MKKYLLHHILSILVLLFSSVMVVGQEVDCGNGQDDDNDGFIDCADSECSNVASCSTAFLCSNTLYQVISQTLNKLDPLTGEYEPIGNATFKYNGAGYNVQDGYIYGLNTESNDVHLWQINSQGQETDLGKINNFSGRTFVGDFDDQGNLYTYKSGTNAKLSYIDVNVTPLASSEIALTHLVGSSTPSAADITFNPKFKKFYGLSGAHQLFELDQKNLTSKVLGDFSDIIDVTGSFGAAWSDRDGNSYFANNSTGKIFRFIFNDDGSVKDVTFVATGQPTNSNDGMGCFYSLPPFETNCTDNIDNDGDGLTDCEDPDCAQAGVCPSIEVSIRSINKAGPLSIIPFHIQMINKSNENALGFSISCNLPSEFSFIADTIELSTGSTTDLNTYPIEGDRELLIWKDLNIPIGDTITLAFSLLVDESAPDGSYNFAFESEGVISSPYYLHHQITIDQTIYNNAKPFDCKPSFYQVYKKRGEPNILGKLNPSTAKYDFISVINHQANGLGHDVISGYAYGSDGKKFIRMDQYGNVTYMGLDFEKKVYVGDMDTLGYWYGKVGKDMVKVNVSSNQVENVFHNQGMPGWDMAYNSDGNFYAVHGQKVYRFNTQSNAKESLGEVTGGDVPPSGHGAQWTGLDGYHYISNNSTGKIFRVDISSLETVMCMEAESNLQYNDGFACPDVLPVVYQYDFGDNAIFPMARQLVYDQDLGDDDIPDYSMVWLGKEISHELLDPSNPSATGDTKDDGLRIRSEATNDDFISAELTLNANRDDLTAYWGIWIDWDIDGDFDTFYSGNETINGSKEIQLSLDNPQDIQVDKFAVRARTSGVELIESNFAGDINEPGEVEDYFFSINSEELCDNGIDDDHDGLVDCDDPICVKECDYSKSGSAGDGGLESNGNLIQKITTTLFERKREGQSNNQSKHQMATFGKSMSESEFDLKSLIPVDIIEGSETKISSPRHLIDVTNAVDLFSVDIFKGENRVGAILSLETEKGVYEHTKYICDRLTGSKILDIYEYKIDGIHNFIITKFELQNGDVEYASSFSFHKTNTGETTLESFWNLEDYTKDISFFNFQVWANNTRYLIDLCEEIIRLTNKQSTINEYKMGRPPELYIKTGHLENGKLILDLNNKSRLKYMNAVGNFSMTETSNTESFNQNIQLSGEVNETIKIEIGDVYYFGLAFHHPELEVEDVIFMANGAWGYSFDDSNEVVDTYNVESTSYSNEDRYNVQRSISSRGQVKNYISFYRSFEPRFKKKDLDRFNSLSLKAKGNALLEIAVMKEGITQWSKQPKIYINLTPNETEYTLGKEFFKDINGISNTWEDATMIAINVLGNNHSSQPFNMNISDVYFGHTKEETTCIIYTDKNMIGPKDIAHKATYFDGTDLGDVKIGETDTSVIVYLKNISSQDIIVDDIEIEGGNGSFDLHRFEPSIVEAGNIFEFKILHNSNVNKSSASGDVNVYIDSKNEYHQLTFNVLANPVCANQRFISDNDLKNSEHDEQIAKQLIASDATINSNSNCSFAAGQEIILKKGFEVKFGGQIELLIADKCPLNQE